MACKKVLNLAELFSACVRSAMLHGSETWAPSVSNLKRLQRNDRAMIRWICGTKPHDRTPSSDLLLKLGIVDITTLLQTLRLHWYGHVKRASTCINSITELPLPGKRNPGRPVKTWLSCIDNYIIECDLSQANPLNREDWKRTCRLLSTPVAGTEAAV